jgi:hypothetical protein
MLNLFCVELVGSDGSVYDRLYSEDFRKAVEFFDKYFYYKRKFLNVFTNNENKVVKLVLFNDTKKDG